MAITYLAKCLLRSIGHISGHLNSIKEPHCGAKLWYNEWSTSWTRALWCTYVWFARASISWLGLGGAQALSCTSGFIFTLSSCRHYELEHPGYSVGCQWFWLMALVHRCLFSAHFGTWDKSALSLFCLLVRPSAQTEITAAENGGRFQKQPRGIGWCEYWLSNDICRIMPLSVTQSATEQVTSKTEGFSVDWLLVWSDFESFPSSVLLISFCCDIT